MKRHSQVAFNLSRDLRTILRNRPNIACKNAVLLIASMNPHVKINPKSFGVAFYTTRKKMGIAKARKTAIGRQSSVSNVSGISNLISAAKFIRIAGSPENALEAIQQVQSIQF